MTKQTKKSEKSTFLKKCKMEYYTDKQLYHSWRKKKWEKKLSCFLW